MLNYVKSFGIVLLAIAFFWMGGYIADKLINLHSENSRLHTELIGQKEAYQQLSDRAAKLENNYVEQKRLKELVESEFAREKDALTGRIKTLSNATYLIRERARKSGKSDIVYQGKRLKYVVNEIRFNDGPPVGYVLIFDDGRVISKLYNHRIDAKTATSRDETTGKYSILSRADWTLLSPSINTNGEKNWFKKPFPLKITGGTAFIDPTEPNQLAPRLHWWAPHLNANINIGSAETINPGLGLSLAGYGATKNDLQFRFAQFGVEYLGDRKFGATLIPIMWRPIPSILSNTYLAPGASFTNGNFGYFFSVQVGL